MVALASLLLAALLVAQPAKGLLVAGVVIGLVFAVLDSREAIHQANESSTGLLVLALLTGLLHLSAARGRRRRAALADHGDDDRLIHGSGRAGMWPR